MNVIFLGPPGAGKGTQAKQLAERRGWVHLSTGDLLRKAIAEESDLGRKAKSHVEKGALVPDDLVIALIRDTLPDTEGFVLDGFPRTIEQARALDEMLTGVGRSIEAVVNLSVDDKEVVRRISGRRQCENGHVFNVSTNPSQSERLCDTCGSELRTRKDDEPNTTRRRLEVYRTETEPLIEFYRRQGKLRNVSGLADVQTVTHAIDAELRS